MSEVEELKVHIESLEIHVARLEGIIHVMLEQIEAGTIEVGCIYSGTAISYRVGLVESDEKKLILDLLANHVWTARRGAMPQSEAWIRDSLTESKWWVIWWVKSVN